MKKFTLLMFFCFLPLQGFCIDKDLFCSKIHEEIHCHFSEEELSKWDFFQEIRNGLEALIFYPKGTALRNLTEKISVSYQKPGEEILIFPEIIPIYIQSFVGSILSANSEENRISLLHQTDREAWFEILEVEKGHFVSELMRFIITEKGMKSIRYRKRETAPSITNKQKRMELMEQFSVHVSKENRLSPFAYKDVVTFRWDPEKRDFWGKEIDLPRHSATRFLPKGVRERDAEEKMLATIETYPKRLKITPYGIQDLVHTERLSIEAQNSPFLQHIILLETDTELWFEAIFLENGEEISQIQRFCFTENARHIFSHWKKQAALQPNEKEKRIELLKAFVIEKTKKKRA